MTRICFYVLFFCLLSCQTKQEKSNNQETTIATDTTSVSSSSVVSKVDTLLNSEDYLILSEKAGIVKVVSESQLEEFPDFEIMIGYRGDIVIAKGLEYDDVQLFRKYNPQTTFEDYPAKIYKGPLADPDFSTDPDAKRFITRITKGCEEGINFAGHYTLITWGCGSPCQSGVVVDRKTGAIYGGYGTALGAEFKTDSRLLIRNVGAIDTATQLIRLCAYCDVNHEVWMGTVFEEVE